MKERHKIYAGNDMYTLHKIRKNEDSFKVNLVIQISDSIRFPGLRFLLKPRLIAKGDSSVFLAIYSQLLTWPHC
jgi:hypothetical protein